MKIYPQYDPVVRWNGERCTVTVTAATKCGPEISAKSTVTRMTRRPESDPELVRKALEIARRNLGYEYELVVKACKRAGTHEGH